MFFYICAQPIILFAQPADTVLTYDEFLENMLRYHPVAKKADLKIDWANAQNQKARGTLDPKIQADWSQKNFEDKLYFRNYQVKFNIPTRYGINFTGGYENSNGVFLNPENTTGNFGLWNAGVEVNLLQGLLVNERRTALEQAKVFQNLAKNEQRIILNDLIYNASAAYLNWQQFSAFNNILIQNLEITNKYYKNTKTSYLGGEKTGMDTLEAYILFQDALTDLQKGEQELLKAKQDLENFLWFDNAPITLKSSTKPENYNTQIFRPLQKLNNALLEHPIIEASLNKLSVLEIEQRLKREKLKPKLKVKYNPLLSTNENNPLPAYAINDFKWGFGFSVPLFRRTEKAEVQLGQIKMEETQLDIINKRNVLENKIDNSWQQQILLQQQLVVLDQNIENYKQLLNGETIKFEYGESSVFLLNKRQEKFINGQLKRIELFIKRQYEVLKFLYFSNQLIDS